ncbi:MAG: DUF1343 domain-containing protein, partial [bacterium]
LFRPISFRPYYGKYTGKILNGAQIYITDYSEVDLMSIQFLCLQVHNAIYPERNPFLLADSSRLVMFDKVAGSNQIRKLFTKRMNWLDVRDYLNKDVTAFREKSRHYHLYN